MPLALLFALLAWAERPNCASDEFESVVADGVICVKYCELDDSCQKEEKKDEKPKDERRPQNQAAKSPGTTTPPPQVPPQQPQPEPDAGVENPDGGAPLQGQGEAPSGEAGQQGPESAARGMGKEGRSAMQRGASKAQGVADKLKGSLLGEDAAGPMPDDKPRAQSAAASRPAFTPAAAAAMPGLVAAAGPYREVFESRGLRVEAGTIVRSDGSRASGRDIRELKEAIDSEPEALTRFPYLFEPGRGGISREDFLGLKEIYREKPQQKDFKHIELADERDFKRSESCDKVSGDCNKHAKQSYKKGEFVPPQDLKDISASISASLGLAKDRERGLRSRLGSAGGLSALLSKFFGGSGGPAGEAQSVEAGGVPAVERAGWAAARTAGAEAADAPRDEAGVVPVGRTGRPSSFLLIAAVVGSLLLAAGLALKERR